MSDASREQLQAEIEALRAVNAVQVEEIERLTRKIAELVLHHATFARFTSSRSVLS
jgi:hypothetical protein